MAAVRRQPEARSLSRALEFAAYRRYGRPRPGIPGKIPSDLRTSQERSCARSTKSAPASAWREAERQGVYRGSADDLRDGFIHFSTASQVDETARKHFFGQTGLFLIAVDADALGDALRWEPSRNDELFPHLYGELDLGAVTAILDLRARSDGYSRRAGACPVIRAFDAFSLPLLRWLDPEDAHRLAIQGLRLLPPVRPRADDHKLAVRAFGLNFPNPIGMAAGFDKSAEVPDALLRLGFGFVEIGSVTPRPQGGNPRPRLFRLERDEAVINRMGFNNDGAEVALRRLAARAHHGGIVGVNVGANKDLSDRTADYVKLIETFAPVASYFTVNVSSPNTPGLRNLQQSAALDDLLAKVIDARERVRKNAGDLPVLLKIAPDLSLAELDDVVQVARSRRVDGMIVANTTMARPSTLREQSARRSRAACPAGRCSACRRAWWRRPMCAPKARFR